MEKEKAIERALALFSACLYGSLPDQAIGDFRAWMTSDYHSEEKIEAMYRLWKRHVKVRHGNYSDAMRSFAEVARRLGFPESVEQGFRTMQPGIPLTVLRDETTEAVVEYATPAPPPARRILTGRKLLLRAAAVVLPLAVIGGAAWFYLSQPSGTGNAGQQTTAPLVTVTVPDTTAARGSTGLGDGTHILVGRSSTLRYAETFGPERRVSLEGEAYFDVARDTLRPFIVEAGALQVRVLGTKFNVNAAAGSPYTTVALYSGRIEVSGGKLSTPVILNPGEQFVYENASGTSKLTPTGATLPDWILGRMNFEQASTKHVLETIAWFYGVQIDTVGRFDDTERLTFRYTGDEDLETALLWLQSVSTNRFEYTTDGKRVTITSEN